MGAPQSFYLRGPAEAIQPLICSSVRCQDEHTQGCRGPLLAPARNSPVVGGDHRGRELGEIQEGSGSVGRLRTRQPVSKKQGGVSPSLLWKLICAHSSEGTPVPSGNSSVPQPYTPPPQVRQQEAVSQTQPQGAGLNATILSSSARLVLSVIHGPPVPRKQPSEGACRHPR